MGGLDSAPLWPPTTSGRRAHIKAPMLQSAAASDAAAEVQEADIERVRRIFDEDLSDRPHCAVNTPREDAKQFRNCDKHTVPCECIAELYELLWRWGHRASGSFVKNFGFALPETIIIVKGKPYAWYFISKKDGRLLRKSEQHLSVSAVERKLCREGAEGSVCGTWLPAASQFPEARSHSPNAEFMGAGGLGGLLGSLRPSHNGIIQAFVQPPGISNFLARTVTYRQRTSMLVRTNRSVLNSGGRNMFDRVATFEGWEGLSASSGQYNCHKFPHMEELILAVGESLNRRVEEENMRQMLFLNDDQHVALHFKVAKDGMLYFIYGSVVSEREVMLQTREKLIMSDRAMTEELPGAALLRGGTFQSRAPRMHIPYEVRHDMSKWYSTSPTMEEESQGQLYGNGGGWDTLLAEAPLEEEASPAPGPRAGSLPPIRQLQQQTLAGGAPTQLRQVQQQTLRKRSIQRSTGALSARGSSTGRSAGAELSGSTLPRMAYPHPVLPGAPFKVNHVGDTNLEQRRYETIAAQALMSHGQVKRSLISSTGPSGSFSARSCGGLAAARAERPLIAQEGDLDDKIE